MPLLDCRLGRQYRPQHAPRYDRVSAIEVLWTAAAKSSDRTVAVVAAVGERSDGNRVVTRAWKPNRIRSAPAIPCRHDKCRIGVCRCQSIQRNCESTTTARICSPPNAVDYIRRSEIGR